jgi:hypothetical protein
MSTTYEDLRQALRESDREWTRRLEAIREEIARIEGPMLGALREIVEADPVDLALDPTWAQRIARAGLGES